jgi:hypothetical protein
VRSSSARNEVAAGGAKPASDSNHAPRTEEQTSLAVLAQPAHTTPKQERTLRRRQQESEKRKNNDQEKKREVKRRVVR